VATPLLTVDASDRLTAVHFCDSTRPAVRQVRGDGPGVHGSRTIDLDDFLSGLPVTAGTPLVTPKG
jgi:sugar phosphate isomerase/epimerase